MSATDSTFGEYAFAQARVRWEAEREMASLEAELATLTAKWREECREIRWRLRDLRKAVWPADFRDAMLTYPDGRWKIYSRLADAGIATFEEVALKSSEELLEIKGIGPKAVTFIRGVLEDHGYAHALGSAAS